MDRIAHFGRRSREKAEKNYDENIVMGGLLECILKGISKKRNGKT